MASDKIGPIQALKEGWNLFRRYPIVLLGGFCIFVFLLFLCVKIPVHYLNWALLAAITFPLLGGLHILLLNAANDSNPRLFDIFSGFRQWRKWLTVGWTFVGVFNVFFVPCLLVLFAVASLLAFCPLCPAVAQSHDAYWVQLKIFAAVLATIPALALFSPYGFMLFAAAEATNTNQSVARSQALVKGRQSRVFLTLFLQLTCPAALLILGRLVVLTNANAFGLPGWAAFSLGLIVALTIALCGMTRAFMSLSLVTPPPHQ